MSDPVGRPSELNDELCLEIRAKVLEGKNMRIIAEELGIAYKTMEGWMTQNYKGFSDRMLSFKQEWRLKKAEQNIDEVLEMTAEEPVVTSSGVAIDKDGKVITQRDSKLLKIKADVSTFVAETVGKKVYSKRSEHTGEDGKPMEMITKINYIVPHGNNTETNTETAPSISSSEQSGV
jgi:transposase